MTLNTKPETISQYCLVSSVTFKKTKTGKDYAELTLSDKSATIPACKVWDVTEEVKEILKNNDVLYIDGEADNYGGSYKVTIKNDSLHRPRCVLPPVSVLFHIPPSLFSCTAAALPSILQEVPPYVF